MQEDDPNTKTQDTQPDSTENQTNENIPLVLPIKEPSEKHNLVIIGVTVLAIIVFSAVGWGIYTLLNLNQTQSSIDTATDVSILPEGQLEQAVAPAPVEDLVLDTAKNYGNKYSNGILPVGDNKYVTDSAKKGYIYTCAQYAQSFKTDNIGAEKRGPWFVNNNTQYDINKKISVQGNKTWKGEFSNKIVDATRTITTNGLPSGHATGTFPVSSSDPAYSYDKNPNTIAAQDLTYELSTQPKFGDPRCMDGEAGVMLTGVSLFNGFDAGARDAGAWEVQDACEGHPQIAGQYHYHTLSSCIKDISVSTVVGFAIDGFPITGPMVGDNNILTTDDLDVCHGITSKITLEGKEVTTYHYVMTQDFPYSVSCFRGAEGESSGTGEVHLPPVGPPPEN